MAPDADHPAVLDQDLLDREAFADLGAGLRRGLDQLLVEDGPARAIADGGFIRARRAFDREGAEVVGVGVDRRASGRHEAIEQAPPRQGCHAKGVQDVGADSVAWKCRAVDREDPVPLPGQQHRGRGPGAAHAHDDDIECVGHRGSPAPSDLMTPSCCIRPSSSTCAQHSTTLPSAMRSMSVPVRRISRPVAGMPWKLPLCVPRAVQRVTTMSPSAIWSSMVKRRSGNAVRNIMTNCLAPSRPRMSWDEAWMTRLLAATSSTTPRSPRL